jgi:mannan endo-1,6-alpha-mannosidase
VTLLKLAKGNDDQAFWGLALMSALENQFPDPPSSQPQWLPLLETLFDNQALRWDVTSCGGGLKWQIYPENAYGYDYKNSISNGAFFQLAARLARYTGYQKYVAWAEKTWNWCRSVNLIADNYDVYDGTDDKLDCRELDHTRWSYNVAVFLEGAAALYSLTGLEVWAERTSGLLDASTAFFSPNVDSTNVMYEPGCEPYGTCNVDQQSFKAYLARWLAKTAVLAPFTAPAIRPMLETSAQGAAASCSGGLDGVTCGSKWYTGNWDGTWGVGQQLSALEVVQALLAIDAGAPFSRYLSSQLVRRNTTDLHARVTGAHEHVSNAGLPMSTPFWTVLAAASMAIVNLRGQIGVLDALF